ncbi:MULTISPECIES: FmdB family zinc ribbon protein [Mycobacterium]|uniref:FmdB family transcriptional regulator n=1 Tax=Mycobacterium colombiense TaxID=339268 RepID=A0A329LWP3_9MYCO|nr:MULTISPECIES: FmdB family zinc ribbon protein [Mycobacterium]MDM4140427.1 zinc ribbon domain-containing protein [Mycobacterium sp. FLAC0960]RAV12291.1 FmdB family transcriptional regulator [Mycobacterium colombiense]
MPTYSYQCTECDDRFDIVQAFTDDALTTCKRCSGRLRKRFNSVGVVFKGSGFYRTDSRESGKKSSGSTNGSSSSDSGSSASSSSDKSGSTSSEKSGSSSSDKSSSSTTSTAAATN